MLTRSHSYALESSGAGMRQNITATSIKVNVIIAIKMSFTIIAIN